MQHLNSNYLSLDAAFVFRKSWSYCIKNKTNFNFKLKKLFLTQYFIIYVEKITSLKQNLFMSISKN